MKTIAKIKNALIALFTVSCLMISCSKDDPINNEPDDLPGEDPVLTVSNSSAELVFSADGTILTANGSNISPTFTVTTNQESWDISTNQAWLRVSTEGNKFTLSADVNTSLIELSPAKVTVSAGMAEHVILTVTQLSPDPEQSEHAAQSIILGRGYDVTGSYAKSTEVKSAILDFTKLVRNGMVKKDGNLNMAEFYTKWGSTATEYTTSLAIQAGISTQIGVEGVGAFSSELTGKFNTSRTTKDAYSFATSVSRIIKDAYFVEERRDPEKLRSYVSAAFLADLDSKTDMQIIEKYGTHVMLGGVWGARLDHHFSAKKKIEAYSREIGVAFTAKAEMSAGGITGKVGHSESVENNYSSLYDTKTEEISTTVYGGKPEYAQSIHNKQEYDKWIESIEGNEIWCDYYPESLIPIYELISNETKRNSVRETYINYLAGKKITVTSSIVNTHIYEQFSLIGAVIQNGDGEMDTDDGKPTKWSLEITLSKKDIYIRADFVYVVEEGSTSSNRSIFEMRKYVDFPINRDDFIIDHKPLSWSSGEQIFAFKFPDSDDSDVRGWIPVTWLGTNRECPFLRYQNWWFKIDDRGGNDHEKVGVKGWMEIHYSYIE